MRAISRCSVVLFFAGVEGARIARKTGGFSDVAGNESVHDCYSKYDGRALLRLAPCTAAGVAEISLQLERLGCTLLDQGFGLPPQGCAESEAVCSGAGAATLEKYAGVSITSMDAGSYWRKTSGLAQPFEEGLSTAGAGAAEAFFSNWRDVDAQAQRVESLVQASGGIASIETVGQTLQGRDMKIVRFTGAGYSSGKPKVVLTFNMHAREWITGMSGVYAVEQLIAKVKQEPSYLDGMEVVIMPMANPDGFVHSMTSDRMHRKNMRKVSSSCWGVDINRNWDSHWAYAGSSNDVCSDTYHGPAPMSEPETNVIAKVMKESPMTVYVDVHAYSQLVLEAYGWTTATHPRRPEYAMLGKALQTAIKSSHGITFTEGPIAKTLYAAAGSSVDYADDMGALGICIEGRPGRYGGGGFAPPTSAILPGAEEIFASVLASIDYAADPPEPTEEPPNPCPYSWCGNYCWYGPCQGCAECR